MFHKKLLLSLLIAFGIASTGLAADRYATGPTASQASTIESKGLGSNTGYDCSWFGVWYCW